MEDGAIMLRCSCCAETFSDCAQGKKIHLAQNRPLVYNVYAVSIQAQTFITVS